ncbi:MAG: hypothetical protein IKS77_01750 [Spirochaetales bacterium]|nr:hypothetical protein [Spirochaetales bacterium]
MKLSDFKGEDAFKVMGKVISYLKEMFIDPKATEIVNKKEQGWMFDFLTYSLGEQSKIWLNLFCTLNPEKKAEDVSTADVISFAYEFTQDEQMMSLFFSQSRTKNVKTSIGSAMENTEV